MSRKKKLVWGLIIFLVIALGASSYFYYTNYVKTGPIPRKYARQLKFAPYYPTKLPSGYSVDDESFTIQDGVLIFYINSPKNKKIGVSEQTQPAGVTLPQPGTGPVKVPNEKAFDGVLGHTYIGLEGAQYVSETITSDGTWIILNLNGFTLNEATILTQSFSAVK